MVPDIFL